MKYVYYIVVITIIFSGLAAYGVFDTQVKISKPFLSINDRIISEDEFKEMLSRKPSYMGREQFIESVIAKQLLIQEAIREDINKEENFRRSVENFYEQSLIKILLDRKLDSLIVDVTNEEIAKYKTLTHKKFFLTKMVYSSMKDAKKKSHKTIGIERLEADFIDLSDDLKFIVLNLNPGEFSKPRGVDFGVIVYRLDDVQIKKISETPPAEEFDIKKVSLFIQDKKKEQLLDEWADGLRETAEIWRKNE